MQEVNMQDVFIVGCGYVGLHVAQSCLAQQQRVIALARSTDRSTTLQSMDITPVAGDLDKPETLRSLSLKEMSVFYFAPPPSEGITDPRLTHFLDSINPEALPARIVLISTTGVYGNCGGVWIDERWVVNPKTDRALRRIQAEKMLAGWCKAHGVEYVILRVPGIYGPYRLPIKRLQKKLPVLHHSIAPFSNRIHLHDLTRACVAAMEKGHSGEIYNVSDGHPTTMTDYFNQVADAVGLERPPVIDRATAQTQLSAEMRSYLAESRRLDNQKMYHDLDIAPDYPTLSAGLAQCIQVMRRDVG